MPNERLPSAELGPGMLPNEELFWHWRRSLAPFFDSVPLADPRDPPQAPQSRQYHLGQFLFVEARYSRQKFVRDAAWGRRHDDTDHILVQTFLHGRNHADNGGLVYVEEPGGTFAVNLGYTADATCTDAETLTLILPRDWLAEHLPGLRDARGTLFGKDSMAARLFNDFMVSLQRNLPNATTADAPVIGQSLLGLLGSLVTHEDPASTEARSGMLMAVKRHIDDALGDLDLGADSLCARFRLSRATLFRLFKDEGGVQSYIQRRRLMACFRALGAPRHLNRLIYDVALDYGFTNPSHLSTLFRQHFGMSPREVREAARDRHLRGAAASSPADDHRLADVELMRLWALELGGAR